MSSRHPLRGQYVLGQDLDTFPSTNSDLCRSKSPSLNLDLFWLVYLSSSLAPARKIAAEKGPLNHTLTYQNSVRYTSHSRSQTPFPLSLVFCCTFIRLYRSSGTAVKEVFTQRSFLRIFIPALFLALFAFLNVVASMYHRNISRQYTNHLHR